jgi:hypothetical protein
MPPLTAAKEASLITRLDGRTEVEQDQRQRQRAGRVPQGDRSRCSSRLGAPRGTMGIYAIETNWTGALAGTSAARPQGDHIESGPPLRRRRPNELDPVTWPLRDLNSPCSQNTLAGNTKLE